LSVDFAALADKAEAFTCADLENVVRSAGRKAIMDNAQAVTNEYFEQALCEVQKIVKAREDHSSLSHCYI
jgi:ATP-dependent 26S proteasome regulatory subunit